jgi:hypothetical protein
MATVIIKKSAAIVFVGRYLTLPIAQNMATIKAAEYGVGTTAWTTDQDLPYANPPTTAPAVQAWTK